MVKIMSWAVTLIIFLLYLATIYFAVILSAIILQSSYSCDILPQLKRVGFQRNGTAKFLSVCSSCFDHRTCPSRNGRQRLDVHRRIDSRQSDGIVQMIMRGVHITMLNKTASGTSEGFFAQRHLFSVPALATSLATSPCLGVFDKCSTACDSFVLEHFEEASPRRIADMLGETMIAHHSFDIQILDSNPAELQSQTSAQLMLEVVPLIGNPDMAMGNLESGFAPIPASFLLAGQSPLQTLQASFALEQEMGVRYACPIAQSGKVCQPNINAHRLIFVRMLNDRNIDFTTEYSEPLTSTIGFDGECLGCASWNSMQDDWDIPNLGAEQSSLIDKLESTLRVGDALDSGFEAWKSSLDLLAFLSFFDSAKEIVKSFAQSVTGILKHLAVDFITDFRMAYLDVFHKRIEVKLPCHPKLLVQAKKLVVDKLAVLESFEKPYLLLRRRIQSAFIHSQFHRGVLDA